MAAISTPFSSVTLYLPGNRNLHSISSDDAAAAMGGSPTVPRPDPDSFAGVGEWSLISTTSDPFDHSITTIFLNISDDEDDKLDEAYGDQGKTPPAQLGLNAWVEGYNKTKPHADRVSDTAIDSVPKRDAVPLLTEGCSVMDTDSNRSARLLDSSPTSKTFTGYSTSQSFRDTSRSCTSLGGSRQQYDESATTSHSAVRSPKSVRFMSPPREDSDLDQSSDDEHDGDTPPSESTLSLPSTSLDTDSDRDTTTSSSGDTLGDSQASDEAPHHSPRMSENGLANIPHYTYVFPSPPTDGLTDKSTSAGAISLPHDAQSRTLTDGSRKRRHESDNDTPASDGGGKRVSRRAKTIPTEGRLGRLACPFWKWDSDKYKSCYDIKLVKISYVKQHLYRSHLQPIHCVFCLEEFADRNEYINHMRARTCSPVPYEPPSGVSPEQRQKLGQRANQKSSPEQQWYDIYQILFPNTPLPFSPYIEDDLSEDLNRFKEFQTTQGAGILTDRFLQFLEQEAPQVRINRRTLEDFVREGQRHMWEEWRPRNQGQPKHESEALSGDDDAPEDSRGVRDATKQPSEALQELTHAVRESHHDSTAAEEGLTSRLSAPMPPSWAVTPSEIGDGQYRDHEPSGGYPRSVSSNLLPPTPQSSHHMPSPQSTSGGYELTRLNLEPVTEPKPNSGTYGDEVEFQLQYSGAAAPMPSRFRVYFGNEEAARPSWSFDAPSSNYTVKFIVPRLSRAPDTPAATVASNSPAASPRPTMARPRSSSASTALGLLWDKAPAALPSSPGSMLWDRVAGAQSREVAIWVSTDELSRLGIPAIKVGMFQYLDAQMATGLARA